MNRKDTRAEIKATAGAEIIREAAKINKKKVSIAVMNLYICLSILFILGVASYIRINQSITKQNQIAAANKQHIDCIVKLLATPLPPGARARTLTNPSTTCNINFTQ